MSGLRRLFRGSGRALAFVFAASVAWLLLDMAALRLSLGEAGGRLLREAAGRGPGPGPGMGPGMGMGMGPGLGLGMGPGLGLGRARPRRGPGAPAMAAAEPGAAPGDPGPSPPAQPPGSVGGTGSALPGAPGSEQRPSGTAAPSGPAARDAGTAAQPGAQDANTGPGETPSETRFVLVSKGGMNLAGPAAPRPGPHSAGNAAGRRGKHGELDEKSSDRAHAATATAGATAGAGQSRTLGTTPGTAPGAAGTGQDGQERRGAAPRTNGTAQDGQEQRGAAPAAAPGAAGTGQDVHEQGGAVPTEAGTVWDGQEQRGAAPGTNGTGQDGQEQRGAAPGTNGTGQDGQEQRGAAPTAAGTGQDGQERRGAAPTAAGTGQDGQERRGAAPTAAGTGQDGQERRGAAPGAADTGQDVHEQGGAVPGTTDTVQDGQDQAGSSPGMHRVLSLDATLAPRDPRAPGQFGHPVAVPDDKQEEAKSRWKEGNFNVYLSDLIPVDRAIPDTRPAGCSEQQVHDALPSTSVIMCFVDEVWSALLRSVHSVLSRSPPRLLQEIILVDDCSTKEYLKEQLDVYMSRFPKVKVLHLRERHGLIRARLAGAEIATGAVLTFLDSHVECNVGWLEPLLERVRLRRTKVACPVIEVISDRDMSYMTVDNFQRGIFTWPMNFGWRQIPQEVIEKNKIKETDIIRCPVMAGGLFSIDKKYFSELGMYDPGLDVWGGENMEISFKVWMCGGEIEIVPCSRVGHIFRNDNPYSFPKERVRTVERNLARVAEVWLDEYKELFYGHAYHLLHGAGVGDLSRQLQLRQRLRCKTFGWYLQNVYPDLEAPLVKASGQLVNAALAGCIAVEGTSLAFEKCDANNTNQKFNYTWLRLIQHGELCLAPAGVLGALGLRPCQGRSRSLAWLHRSLATVHPGLSSHLVSQHPRFLQPACLEVDAAFRALRVRGCDARNPHQKWQFSSYHAD